MVVRNVTLIFLSEELRISSEGERICGIGRRKPGNRETLSREETVQWNTSWGAVASEDCEV
jgi:hypothetical protein